MSEAPRLLILGGGSSQVSALRRAREYGFAVVLADQDENAPGREWAHHFERASTFDIDAVEAAAGRSGAQALLAVGTDQPVYTAALVSRRLGLPYPLSVDQALSVTNKAEMKRVLSSAGVPSVPWTLLGPDPARWDEEGPAGIPAPWVVKPVDSQGQRGIRLVRNMQELREHHPVALSFSRDSRILVEQYYPSREVTVSGWAHAGETVPVHGGASASPVTIWTVTDRVTFDPAVSHGSLGVCLAHRFPSDAAREHLERINELTARIVRALTLHDVPVYFQFLIGNDGVRVNEIACRLGGAYEDQSIPRVTGVDVLAVQLEWYWRAIGSSRIKPALESAPESALESAESDSASGSAASRAFAVPLMFARPGVVRRLRGAEELRRLPGVAECRFLLPEGTTIRPMVNSTQRIAYAVLHGPDARTVNDLVDTLFDRLRVEDCEGNNLLIDTRAETKIPVR
ncbi:MAG: hypothetical protein ACLFO1_03155 [Spirochaetaceae bacterium]